MRTRGAIGVALVGVVCLAQTKDALANMAKWWSEGELHGPLVPQDDTEVRVDSEDLTFVVAPSLASAEVTATYRMTNGGATDSKANIAFVMVASESAGHGGQGGRRAPQATVTIDGEPVTSHVVTESEVLAPRLEAWLEAHPDAKKELARLTAQHERPSYSDAETLHRFAPGCRGECDALLRWYSDRDDVDNQVRAAEEAIPDETAKVRRGWTKRSDSGPLAWLTFPLAIGAGATRTVRVQYTHISGSDRHKAVNEVFTYVYMLSPAKRWARFGDLHIDIRLPPDATIQSSSIPFSPDAKGGIHRASLSGLPEGELDFDVMSRRGLLFGMSRPTGYWLMLVALMALLTIPGAARLGRVWARAGSPSRRVLGCIFGTGAAATLWNGVAMSLLGTAFPRGAFGNGYDALFGFTALMFLFVVAAIVISFAATRAQMPKAATPD